MKELYTAFDHAGAVVELNRRSTNDLVRYVGSECKKTGHQHPAVGGAVPH
jgi:hypothetical protein